MYASDIQQHFCLSFLYMMQSYIWTGHPSVPLLTWRQSQWQQPPFGNLYQINKTAISSTYSKWKLLHFTLIPMSSSEQNWWPRWHPNSWHTMPACLFYLSTSGFQTWRYRQAEYSKIKTLRQTCGNRIIWRKKGPYLSKVNTTSPQILCLKHPASTHHAAAYEPALMTNPVSLNH